MIRRDLALFLFPLMLLSAAPLFAQDFTISKFHSDIIINDDSSFTVKETLYGDLVEKKYFLRSPEKVRAYYMVEP